MHKARKKRQGPGHTAKRRPLAEKPVREEKREENTTSFHFFFYFYLFIFFVGITAKSELKQRAWIFRRRTMHTHIPQYIYHTHTYMHTLIHITINLIYKNDMSLVEYTLNLFRSMYIWTYDIYSLIFTQALISIMIALPIVCRPLPIIVTQLSSVCLKKHAHTHDRMSMYTTAVCVFLHIDCK